jgi:hypothetical protein
MQNGPGHKQRALISNKLMMSMLLFILMALPE